MYLAYASSSGFIKIWDLKTSNTGLNYKLTNNYITTLSFNNESTYLTTGTSSGEVMNFNMLTSTPSSHKFNSFFKLNQLKYSPIVGNLLGSVFDDGCVRVMDMTTGDIVNNFGGYHQGPANSLSFSPINKVFLCSVGQDSRINFFDISTKKHVKTLLTDSPINSVCFFSDGQTIACGNNLGNIVLYDLRYFNTPKAVLKGHQSAINCLDFSKRSFNKITGSNLSSMTNTSKVLDNVSMTGKSNRSFGSIDANIPKDTISIKKAEKVDKTLGDSKTNFYEQTNKFEANANKIQHELKGVLNLNNQISQLNSNRDFSNNVNKLKPLSMNESMNSLNNNNATCLPINNHLDLNTANNTSNNFNMIDYKDSSLKEINIDKKNSNKKDPLILFKNQSLNNLHNNNNNLNNNPNNNGNVPNNVLNLNPNTNNLKSNLNINMNLQTSHSKANNFELCEDPKHNYNDTNTYPNNERIGNYIKTVVESEMFKMKSFIHEEINSLHVDLIRQFEIQNVSEYLI
jgi:hypothetical protein